MRGGSPASLLGMDEMTGGLPGGGRIDMRGEVSERDAAPFDRSDKLDLASPEAVIELADEPSESGIGACSGSATAETGGTAPGAAAGIRNGATGGGAGHRDGSSGEEAGVMSIL